MILIDLESKKKFGDHDSDVGPRKYLEFGETVGNVWLVLDTRTLERMLCKKNNIISKTEPRVPKDTSDLEVSKSSTL